MTPTKTEFEAWLRSAPPAITGDQSVSVTVALSSEDWFAIFQAASINTKTIDEVLSYIVRERVDLTDWFNTQYLMEDTDQVRERIAARTRELISEAAAKEGQ